MVAENELVVKGTKEEKDQALFWAKEEYRNKLWAAGLTHEQIDAFVEVVFAEADNTVDRIGAKTEEALEEMQTRVVEALGKELRPVLAQMVDNAVTLRMDRLEQRMEKFRKALPIPPSTLFDVEPELKPRRRLRHYVAVGIGAMILGPIALSLVAAGMKALLGSLLSLLS